MVELAPTSIVPAAGAVDVHRRNGVTATFDRELDPSSITPTSCSITGPTGTVAATVGYDVAFRTITILPVEPLDRSTSYMARIASVVRTADGERLANAYEWGFTTADQPAWWPATRLDDGALWDLSRGPSGVVHALWQRAGSLFVATATAGAWTEPLPVGIADAVSAVVTSDFVGTVFVLAANANGALLLCEAPSGAAFLAGELVATGATKAIGVVAGATGHVAMSWAHGPGGADGGVRVRIPGQGLGPLNAVPWSSRPLPSLHPAGDGVVVCGRGRREPWGAPLVWPERRCLDGLGHLTPCDPELAVPNMPMWPEHRAYFDGRGGIVHMLSYAWINVDAYRFTDVFELRSGGAWVKAPITLGSASFSYSEDLAVGADGTVVFVGVSFDWGRRGWVRDAGEEVWQPVDFDQGPAMNIGSYLTAAVTDSGTALVTYVNQRSPGNSRQLLSFDRPARAHWSRETVIASLAGQDAIPVKSAPSGSEGAVLAWSHGGAVWTAVFR